MIGPVLVFAAVFLMATSFVVLWRAFRGPTVADRVVAIMAVATKTTVIIVLIAVYSDQKSYVNVALVYAMIGFVATIGAAKYLIKGKLD